MLYRRVFHEIGAWLFDSACHPSVFCEHTASNGVNADSAGVRAVDYIQFQVQAYRCPAKLLSFDTYNRGLLVTLVVDKSKSGSNRHVMLQNTCNRVMLCDMLCLTTHNQVDKVCISSVVELIGLRDLNSSVLKQFCKRSVYDGCA